MIRLRWSRCGGCRRAGRRPSRGHRPGTSRVAARVVHIHEAISAQLGDRHQGILGWGIAQGERHVRPRDVDVALIAQHHAAHRHIAQGRGHGSWLQRRRDHRLGHAARLTPVRIGAGRQRLRGCAEAEHQALAVCADHRPGDGSTGHRHHLHLIRTAGALQTDALQPCFRQGHALGAEAQGTGTAGLQLADPTGSGEPLAQQRRRPHPLDHHVNAVG